MVSEPDPITATLQVPACEKCGRQDETLRAVVFPFVFSLVVVTFQRAFSGLWCARHRRGYLSLAGLITAAGGWLGIPYGFIFTPRALFHLARGGIQSPEANFQILYAVGEKKEREGNIGGAIRCYEESLRFNDSPEVQQRISRLNQLQRPIEAVSVGSSLLPLIVIPFLLFLSALIGFGAGVLDLVFILLFTPLFGASGSILTVILSWIPYAVLLFFTLLSIRSITGWGVKKARLASVALPRALSILASLFGMYHVLQGRALIEFVLTDLFTVYSYSLVDLAFAGQAYLAYGGIMQIVNVVKFSNLGGAVYVGLWLLAAGLCIYTAFVHATQTGK